MIPLQTSCNRAQSVGCKLGWGSSAPWGDVYIKKHNHETFLGHLRGGCNRKGLKQGGFTVNANSNMLMLTTCFRFRNSVQHRQVSKMVYSFSAPGLRKSFRNM